MDESIVIPETSFSLPFAVKALKSLGMMILGSVIIIIVILIPLIGIPTTLFMFGYTIYYILSTFSKSYIITNDSVSTKDIFGLKTIEFSKLRRLKTVRRNSKGEITQFVFELKGGDLKYYPCYFDQEVGEIIAKKFGHEKPQ